MPKYYIKSGQVKYIIDRPNPEEAIVETLRYYKGKGKMTGLKICISETGFDDHNNWECADTDGFMKRV